MRSTDFPTDVEWKQYVFSCLIMPVSTTKDSIITLSSCHQNDNDNHTKILELKYLGLMLLNGIIIVILYI